MFAIPLPSKEEARYQRWFTTRKLAETLLPSVIRANPNSTPENAAKLAMSYAIAIRDLEPPTTDKED